MGHIQSAPPWTICIEPCGFHVKQLQRKVENWVNNKYLHPLVVVEIQNKTKYTFFLSVQPSAWHTVNLNKWYKKGRKWWGKGRSKGGKGEREREIKREIEK